MEADPTVGPTVISTGEANVNNAISQAEGNSNPTTEARIDRLREDVLNAIRVMTNLAQGLEGFKIQVQNNHIETKQELKDIDIKFEGMVYELSDKVMTLGLKVDNNDVKTKESLSKFVPKKITSEEDEDVFDDNVTKRSSRPQPNIVKRTRSLSPTSKTKEFTGPMQIAATVTTNPKPTMGVVEVAEPGIATLTQPEKAELFNLLRPLIERIETVVDEKLEKTTDELRRITRSATPFSSRTSMNPGNPDDSDGNSSEDSLPSVFKSKKKKKVKPKVKTYAADSSSDDGISAPQEAIRGVKALDRKRRSVSRFFNTPMSANVGGTIRTIQSVDMRRLPTMEDLCLNELIPSKTLAFFKKFDKLQQNHPEELKMACYLDSSVYATVDIEARKFSEFDELLDERSILDRGEQVLSNDQLREVIRWCNQPESKDQMEECLATSVWEKKTIDKFQSSESTFANFREFINAVIVYNKNFEALMKLIVGKRSRKWFPKKVDGGTGKDYKDKGLVQYYFQGFPNENLAIRIWKRICSDENERKHNCRTYDSFIEAFMDCLDKARVMLLKEQECKGIRDLRYDPTTAKKPEAFGTFKKIRANVNLTSEHEDEKYEDDFNSEDDLKPEDFAASDDERLEKFEMDQRESKDELNDDDWILAVLADQLGKTDKKSMPCFKLAKTGSCPHGKECMYSHDSGVIEKYKHLKQLGPSTMRSVAGVMQRHQNYSKSTPAKTSYPVKPTSILKTKDGDGTRRVT